MSYMAKAHVSTFVMACYVICLIDEPFAAIAVMHNKEMPAIRNIAQTLHATAKPAKPIDRGIIPTENSISTLETRPRTATSMRCIIQAPMWTLTKPATHPIKASTVDSE
jgi:hypothetical protein